MKDFFSKLFIWWNGATLGTLLQIKRRGRLIGTDEYGNTYYEEEKITYDGRKRRWVTYEGYADPSKIPADWHGWLHHFYDETPDELNIKVHDWQKPHLPNLTGTPLAYRPQGAIERGGQRAKSAVDYDAWTPGD